MVFPWQMFMNFGQQPQSSNAVATAPNIPGTNANAMPFPMPPQVPMYNPVFGNSPLNFRQNIPAGMQLPMPGMGYQGFYGGFPPMVQPPAQGPSTTRTAYGVNDQLAQPIATRRLGYNTQGGMGAIPDRGSNNPAYLRGK